MPALYDPAGRYLYNRFGTNWRAVVALICAIGPNMPGMINALDSSIEIGNAKYIYAVSSIFGIVVGAGMHWLLSTLFPDHDSLILEAVYAQDVLDGKVEGYAAAPIAGNTKAERGSVADESSVEEKEAGEGLVV